MKYIWERFAWGRVRMRPDSRRPSVLSSRIIPIAWGLASALFLFAAENIWIDPWLRSKSQRIPSLVPEALSGVWFLAFAICGKSFRRAPTSATGRRGIGKLCAARNNYALFRCISGRRSRWASAAGRGGHGTAPRSHRTAGTPPARDLSGTAPRCAPSLPPSAARSLHIKDLRQQEEPSG